ncbi:hypothetical protein SAMN02799631_06516 [Methylobacterium sp. 174MFSha1.1]|uniref:hypothetical protein n=1 Tax=Methylobacterium sp. 174MFSha1.1 TaxID=1502749 RepID=UPI0008F28842|nr:hypothetical protein [Methylobacterium sp. 174MFSha1.1]SFV16771.1 hypothetical protein SAMN02799631_06516 [Methylobacterium sp. 174MFSha1.1]
MRPGADDNIVDVYRNRRLRPRAWSVREGGRANRHVRAITLRDVRFHVHAAAVARVQALRQRAVCAYARGIPCNAPRYPSAIRVRFNPFEAAAFTTEDGVAGLRASLVHFEEDGSCWAVL